MTISTSLIKPDTDFLTCGLAAHAIVRVTPEGLAVLRRQPGRPLKDAIAPSLLKHADPQTVAGLAAVLQAIHEHDLSGISFAAWGALAGPCFLGRQAWADALGRFREEGAFAISPHLIPHESLHALSGTISQVLRLHGPNFGVGGGPGAAAETLRLAATLLTCQALPGLWVVVTEYDPELIPVEKNSNGNTSPHPVCLALALALRPGNEGEESALDFCWERVKQSGTFSAENQGEMMPDTFSLKSLLDALENARPATWRFPAGGGWVRLRGAGWSPGGEPRSVRTRVLTDLGSSPARQPRSGTETGCA